MFVLNPDVIGQKHLFICDDKDTAKYLLDNGIMYFSRAGEDDELVWIFAKTERFMQVYNKLIKEVK